ncbi:MAG TPA: hypothetical protein ENI85_11420 [Deltaproteobacteria bacterium]|nr:hypothetical protein [Deltaproteobacteria bacterium]
MEHLQHFGLTQDPFSNEPDLRFYFESASHRDVQRRVERGLRQRKGLTLLTGDGGMGKTLLARRILDGLEEEVFEATLLVMLPGAADATGILQRFARQLGTEEPATDRAGLLGQIYERLAIVREDGRHAVLIVDDAQVMTPEVFAELGGLLSLEYEERRLLSMLFVGSPELDRLVQGDPAIAQRVDVRVRLHPLDLANASAYLAHRLEAVSGNPAILPPATMETLYKFGRGRPRLLNTLADNALFEAYLAGRQAIDSDDVERAAADLGIGPDPGSTYSALPSRPPSSPIAAPAGALASQPIPALEDTCSIHPVAAADLRSSPDMATDRDDGNGDSGTRDLDAGLEAALEDFEEGVAAASEMPGRPLGADELCLEPEPVLAKAASVPLEESFSLGAEPEFVMGEAELTPLEAGDGDELEGAFVELIEE